MLNKLLLCVFAVSFCSGSECPRYYCHTGGQNFGDQCMHPVDGNFELEICENSHRQSPYCNVQPSFHQPFNCTSKPRPFKDPVYPGEPCVFDSDCVTNMCIRNKCAGGSLGEQCTSHSDCSVGLYCGKESLCRPQKIKGFSCHSDYECDNRLSCNKTMLGDGTCVDYFSIEDGEGVGLCMTWFSEGVSNLCKSGSCQKNFTYVFDGNSTGVENGVGVCQEPLTISGNYPKTCTDNLDCIGSNSAYSLQEGTCSCGMGIIGTKYCEAWSGDPPSAKVREILKKHLGDNGIRNCHTERRFDNFCLSQTLEPPQIFNYTKNKLLAGDTARYQENDDCTEVIFNQDYFKLSANDFECKAYKCVDSPDWQKDVCITYIGGTNTFGLKECPGDNYCNSELAEANKWLNVTCEGQKPIEKHFPGESCESSDDCKYGNCQLGECQGVAEGKNCTLNEECNPGLYCDLDPSSIYFNTVCQKLKGVGEKCNYEYECVAYATCNTTEPRVPGTCIKYFSVENQGVVPCPVPGFNYMCQSGTCYSLEGSSVGKCVPAPKYEEFPKKCITSNDCAITNVENDKFTGDCQCGYNPGGNSYCMPFLGDEVGKHFLGNVTLYLNSSSMSTCQTTRRHSLTCAQQVADELGINSTYIYLSSLNYTNFAKYIDNDDCVKSIFTSDYWDHVPGPNPGPGPGPGPGPNPPGPNPNDDSSIYLVVSTSLVLLL